MTNIGDTIRVLENIFDVVQNSEPPEEILVEVPVLYGGNYGNDIQRVVQFSKLSEGEITVSYTHLTLPTNREV